MFKTIAVTKRNTETQVCSRAEGSRTEVEDIFKNVSMTRKRFGGAVGWGPDGSRTAASYLRSSGCRAAEAPSAVRIRGSSWEMEARPGLGCLL